MIIKTHAIVLGMVPFSETSRIVTWLTADHGRLATIIKGAQRRKSPFLGQVDLFYTCELLFYLRLHQGVHVARECSPLKTRPELRSRWRAMACASYLARLAARVCPPYAPHPDLFRLLDRALDIFAQEQDLEACLCWFELKTLAALGVAPQLRACLQCRRPLDVQFDPPRPMPAPFISHARGGVLCGVCAGAAGKEAERVAPDVLGLLRFWQQARAWRSASTSRYTPRQLEEAERILGRILEYHLELAPLHRNLALEAVRHRFRRPGITP